MITKNIYFSKKQNIDHEDFVPGKSFVLNYHDFVQS